jgi:threonyl-tRNA synthetase
MRTHVAAGKLISLCRGPHVLNSGVIGDVMLTSCSAVHLQQQVQSTTVQCQRVSGTAAPSKSQLAEMVAAKEAAKARDHRVLGTSMGLFFFDNVSPGSAFFTPIGTRLYNALLQWMREIYKARACVQLIRLLARPHSLQPGLWIQRSHNATNF